MWFKRIIIDLYLSFLEKTCRGEVHQNDGTPLDFDQSKILVVFSDADLDTGAKVKEISNDFKKLRSDIMLLAVNNNQDSITDAPLNYVNYNDLTFTGKPRGDFQKFFCSSNIDLLLSLIKKPNRLERYIIRHLTANYKAGIHDEDSLDMFDIVISGNNSNSIKLFKEFEHYIKNLNINR